MSTTSLPSYVAPSFTRTPSYTAEPQAYEQRLALNRLRQRPSGEFTKQSKGGGIALRFLGQEENASYPVYGTADIIEGIVDIAKTEGVHSVGVKIKGVLRLKEIAEGGTVTHELCLSRLSLWNKDRDTQPCPSSLSFHLSLPTKFSDGKTDYPLPPTHAVNLSGMPGFRASVEYSVTATVDRGIVKKAASFFPKQPDNTVSTDFIYYPRSRPAVPLPSPLQASPKAPGVLETPEWRSFDSVIPARASGYADIATKFYIPATRVFSMTDPIPFHMTLQSSAASLAAFMPYGPISSVLSPGKAHTKLQLLRQSIVDVRNAIVFGTKTDIWTLRCIGTGTFQRGTEGADFMTYVGEIRIVDDVKISGFRAGGLSIRDSILLTMSPPDIAKSPFDELRCTIPVRLTTDRWSDDGSGGPFEQPEYSPPSSEEDASSQRFVDYRDASP